MSAEDENVGEVLFEAVPPDWPHETPDGHGDSDAQHEANPKKDAQHEDDDGWDDGWTSDPTLGRAEPSRPAAARAPTVVHEQQPQRPAAEEDEPPTPEEGIEEKEGIELFHEFLRLYPTAEADDYIRLGAWRNDLLRLDYHIIQLHRKDGGAPEPPPLSEVPFPDLSKITRPGMVQNGMVVGPGAPKLIPLASAPVVTALAPVDTTAADERLVMVFTAKHKLEVARAKEIIMALEPRERRAVFLGFKPQDPESGWEELIDYIDTSMESGAWKDLPPVWAKSRVQVAPSFALDATTAAKRPPSPHGMGIEAAKRPRVVLPARPPGMTSSPRPPPADRPQGPRGGPIVMRPSLLASAGREIPPRLEGKRPKGHVVPPKMVAYPGGRGPTARPVRPPAVRPQGRVVLPQIYNGY